MNIFSRVILAQSRRRWTCRPNCLKCFRVTNVLSSQPPSATIHSRPLEHNQNSGTSDNMNSLFWKGVRFASLSVCGFGLGYTIMKAGDYIDTAKKDVFKMIPAVKAALPSDKPPDGPKIPSRRETFNFIADVVRTSGPAVVYIEIIDPRFNRVVSNGSGFVVSENGMILTNAHVVTSRGRHKLVVKLQDGRTFPGQVEEADTSSDLALVKIDCHKLPVMKLGVSSDLQAGEWVVAIGSPLSLSNTVTSGVVSSTNRKGHELGLEARGIDYIQTDASITFGNSGGPLVNLDGEAIGINSMKITAGISFAIPIDYAKPFLAKFQTKMDSKDGQKKVRERRYMGITMVSLTPQLLLEMQQRNIISSDAVHGILVVKVVIGSPAYNGGLKPGDVVTHINGQTVTKSSDIYALLDSTQSLEMAVLRGKDRVALLITPED